MAAGDLTLNIGHLTGLGGLNPNADDARPQNRPGTVSMVVDALGFRIFKYIRAISALTKAQMSQCHGDNLTPYFAVTNQTGTYTTKAVLSGFTVNDHQGKIVYVQDATAGALPEGEFTICASNTATDIIFEPEMPLSAALAANNDLSLIATYQAEVSTAATLAAHCQGIAIGNAGITAGNYGWVQNYGVCQYINVGTPTTTVDFGLICATTGSLDVNTTTGAIEELNVGLNMTITTDDQATPRGLIRLTLFTTNIAVTT